MKPNTLKLLTTGAFFAASAFSASAQIIITEAMSNSTHPGGPGNGDWFEIYNSSAGSVSLGGWSWDDESNLAGTHLFPDVTLAAGEFALVVDENDANISDWAVDTWGFTLDAAYVGAGVRTTTGVYIFSSTVMGGFAGLGAGGEVFYIFDDTNSAVASVNSGSQSSPNAGRSFAWSITGDALGRSAAGLFGAVTAPGDGIGGVGTDIASPGFAAIPEPSSTVALAGLAILGFAAARRRARSA